jgi:hypothetical protein
LPGYVFLSFYLLLFSVGFLVYMKNEKNELIHKYYMVMSRGLEHHTEFTCFYLRQVFVLLLSISLVIAVLHHRCWTGQSSPDLSTIICFQITHLFDSDFLSFLFFFLFFFPSFLLFLIYLFIYFTYTLYRTTSAGRCSVLYSHPLPATPET